MAHVHDHKDSGYFTEQLCTIGVCGALGGVVVMMWAIPNGLNFLGPQFQKPLGNPWLSPVLWGGVAVVALVLIRAVAVWVSVGKRPAAQDHIHEHEHHHDHEHSHDHDHAHCDHDHEHDHSHDHGAATGHTHDHNHDHGHDHGWAPWRYVVLLLPVGLYFLNLVPAAFSNHGTMRTDIDESGTAAAEKGGDPISGFLELGRAAATEQSRNFYAGKTAHITGQVTSPGKLHFGLVRYKISCCAADAVPLKMVVAVKPDSIPAGKTFDASTQLSGKWVDLTGVIQFSTLKDSDEYVTVLQVKAENIQTLPKAPDNPFVY